MVDKKISKIRTVCVTDLLWKKAKLVAYFKETSISSLIRSLIKESFEKNKKNIELAESK